jgi:tetratricopeptide (TPR) repeat protein
MMRHILQDFKGAILDCNEALKLNPNNTTAYNNRGGAYAMLKDYQTALADFDKAISIDSKYADAYNSRGRVKQVLGDQDGACADWQLAYSNGLEETKELIIKYCK